MIKSSEISVVVQGPVYVNENKNLTTSFALNKVRAILTNYE